MSTLNMKRTIKQTKQTKQQQQKTKTTKTTKMRAFIVSKTAFMKVYNITLCSLFTVHF